MVTYNSNYAWMDTETTHLDPNHADVIDVAIIVTDPQLNILSEFKQRILPTDDGLVKAQLEALKVNQYSKETWVKTGALQGSAEIWKTVKSLTDGATIANQNAPFDMAMVTTQMQRFRLKPNWQRRCLDITAYSIMLMRALGIKNEKGHDSASLPGVYKAIGGPEMPEHEAYYDVKRAIFVYSIFLNEMAPVLKRMKENGRYIFNQEILDTFFKK